MLGVIGKKQSISRITSSLLTQSNRRSFTNFKKTVQNAIKPDSKIIVDPGYFRKGDIISVLINKFKNSNALGDAKRNFDDFSSQSFPDYAVKDY